MSAQKGIGRLIQLGVAKEAIRGTAPSSATYWVPSNEIGIQEKWTNTIDEQTYGIIEDSSNAMRVKQWMEGDIKMNVSDEIFPLFLISLLGSVSDAAHSGETTVYDHTIKVSESAQHQSLALYLHDPLSAQDYNYPNSMVDKVEIAYEMGKFVNATVGFKGQKGATALAYSPANTTENRFVPQYLTFKSAATVSGLAAATAIPIKSAKITISQNIEPDDVLGSVTPQDFLTKQFMVEGSFDAIYKNESDFKTNALANTAQALLFDLKNTDVTLGLATKPELKITLAKCYFTELTVNRKLNDIVVQQVKFKAVYSLSDSEMISIVATNTVASY